ncbi:unnamed protein product [Urochloa decumbens]|uniref:DUF6598 domain-containing protein n=1 Tax=Urochloa decumbens TaxID=240449 RepID=A0ABC9FZG1_9POAL
MEKPEQWEDAEARSEALRRRVVVAEEEAVVRLPGKAAAIDRPEPQDPVEDEETFDIFAPIDAALMARLTKKPTSPPDAERAAEWRKAERAKELAWKKYNAEYVEFDDEETWSDRHASRASKFRDEWNSLWSRGYGPFEANTEICSMRFTDEPAPPGTNPCDTLQIFSAKVTGLEGGLTWPLDVFGMVAIRDTIDQRRNIVFDRKRDNCQTLTEKDPCLVLTGPTRAVVLRDPVTIEVKLLVKGTVESEDKILSFLAVEPLICSTFYSQLLNRAYSGKLSTLEFTLGHIVSSVEATIFLQIIDGSWPDGFSGRFVARTTSIDEDAVLLLHSGDKIVPCTDDGNVKLSRCVASVEVDEKLQVSVKANSGMKKDDVFMPEEADEDYSDMEEGGVHAPIVADTSVEKEVVFTPKEAGRSDDTLDIGFCKIKVTVAWSLIWRDLF